MDHLRAYMGFSYIKYSRTSFIPFYYMKEVLNLRSLTGVNNTGIQPFMGHLAFIWKILYKIQPNQFHTVLL
jgi:hypothetical protein